jgi:hypothetical protein
MSCLMMFCCDERRRTPLELLRTAFNAAPGASLCWRFREQPAYRLQEPHATALFYHASPTMLIALSVTNAAAACLKCASTFAASTTLARD